MLVLDSLPMRLLLPPLLVLGKCVWMDDTLLPLPCEPHVRPCTHYLWLTGSLTARMPTSIFFSLPLLNESHQHGRRSDRFVAVLVVSAILKVANYCRTGAKSLAFCVHHQ